MSFMETHMYCSGRVEHRTPDGKKWRQVEVPNELRDLPPDALVHFGADGPKPAGDYADLVFPGGTPFLVGLCALGPPVYLELKEE